MASRMGRGTVLRVAATLIGLAAAPTVAGCNGGTIVGNLRFKRNGSVVSQTEITVGTQYIPADKDIAAARGTCADELTVEVEPPPLASTKITPAPRLETHVFARELAEMNG